MRVFYFSLFWLLLLVYGVLLIKGDETYVALYWKGGGPLCDASKCSSVDYVTDFACSYKNRGNWSSGIKTFQDPLPLQSVVTGVTAVLWGTFDCTETSDQPALVTLILQREVIASSVALPPNLPCVCANCIASYSVNTTILKDWPGYAHGGVNTFQVVVLGPNQICLNRVELFLEYYELTPFVGSIAPLSGPITGGTAVTVIGSSFVDDPDVGCFFGTQHTNAMFLDSTRLTCISPAYDTVGSVDFEIHDGKSNSSMLWLRAEQHSFYYYETPTVKVFSPHEGPLEGGTLVTINGQKFFNTSEGRCRFGFGVSPVKYINPTQITCVSPAVRPNVSQELPLAYAPNGQQQIMVGTFAYKGSVTPSIMLYVYIGVGVFVGLLIILMFCVIARRYFNRTGYEQLKDGGVFTIADIKLGARIGKGNFGEVYYAVWRGTEVAIKKMSAHNLTEQLLKDFQKEVALLKALRHPNVLQFLGASTILPDICLCTEYMPRGSLYTVLHDPAQHISWQLVKKMCIDAAKGCLYLHTFEPMIIHRDLKSHNLLVDDTWKVKVCDFGLSTVTENVANAMTACGTPCWTAPEVLRNERYSEKADIYSFGVVLWECATRTDPFYGMPPYQVILAVAREGMRLPDPRNTVPPAFLALMRECWDENPANRPSMMDILERLEAIDVTDVPDIPCPPSPVSSSRLIT